MSEQTPSSPDNLQESAVLGDEPSMEDILASIRKIISEDEPVAMESPEDGVVDLKSDAELETLGLEDDILSTLDMPVETVEDTVQPEMDVVDLDLDVVLAEMDIAAEPETSTVEAPLTTDISNSDDDILAMLDMDIPFEPETSVADVEPEAELPVSAPVADLTSETDSEMDALLDDILLAPEDDLVEGDEIATDAEFLEQATVENDPDLERVKALMADLADDEGQVANSDVDLDALLAIPEIEPEENLSEEPVEDVSVAETEAEETELAAVEAEETDILGDILNMTLEDEIQMHPEELEAPMAQDVAVDEFANIEANDVAEQIETAETADDLPSLAEIAAAAEADAAEAESAVVAPNPVAATAGLAALGAGAAALGATALGDEAVVDTHTETNYEETPEYVQIQEEPSMPVQAVNTDAILDDVTETAAAGAFAELNQVVEEKAVFNERGPRIGDLVQEALRPMLKDWLDANLKGIVERAVAKEVKRISSGK